MENQMGIMSAVNLLPSTKEQVAVFTQGIKDAIINGDVNPLDVLVQLKMIEKTLEVLKDKEVESEIMREASKFHKDELLEYRGCKLEVKEVGVSYDYSTCNDSDIETLYEEKKRIDEKIKQRESFLKTINGDVYGSDGVQLLKPIKKSTTKIVVTIK